nr:alpha/beta hydrolase-fold protein [uncultured Lachnoanaerobaculum sp.]
MFDTKISLPDNYNKENKYPLILLNDGEINYLKNLKDRAILVGLIPQNRLDAFTPWKAPNLRPSMPDFTGKLNEYHNQVFERLLPELLCKYSIDERKIAYGGYSLGGLAAVYSMYTYSAPSIIFSLCGSFWYPQFLDYCESHTILNTKASLYLQNGKAEGSKHNDILSNAPILSAKLHKLLSDRLDKVTSVFDEYGHHENIAGRYKNLIDWLKENLK